MGDIAELVLRHTRDVPDFPEPGILFKDLTPLFAAPHAFEAVIDDIAARWRGRVDAVAGIEARGFILGAPLALALGVGFVPVRKAGKLPGKTVQVDYDLEYGSATIEVHEDAFVTSSRVLVIDDVLATGGTAAAACELVERAGGTVAGLELVLELSFLKGRERLGSRAAHVLVTV